MTPEHGLALKDVCFNPTGDACVVQSVSGYFQNGLDDDWEETIKQCADSPGSLECLPPFMDPLLPGRVLGGWDSIEDITRAKALTVTWVVNNARPGTEAELAAQEW